LVKQCQLQKAEILGRPGGDCRPRAPNPGRGLS